MARIEHDPAVSAIIRGTAMPTTAAAAGGTR